MFCTKCGTEVNTGNAFCQKCGNPMPTKENIQPAMQKQNLENADSGQLSDEDAELLRNKEKDKKALKRAAIVAAVSVILSVILISIVVSSDEKNSTLLGLATLPMGVALISIIYLFGCIYNINVYYDPVKREKSEKIKSTLEKIYTEFCYAVGMAVAAIVVHRILLNPIEQIKIIFNQFFG